MFTTDLEVVENGFLLTVRYEYRVKKWTYRTYEEIAILRSKIEGYFVEEEIETLEEVMR